MARSLALGLVMAVLTWSEAAGAGEPKTVNPLVPTVLSPHGAPRYSEQQLRHYARALLRIEQVKAAMAAGVASAPPDRREALESLAAARISQILDRSDLDSAKFNALSAAVEKNQALHRRVHQMMMRQQVGY